ncbi:TPA: SDR family oxidoreductase [Candidatus Poribacteria bacterium]|nr:SDR family oxidoreductase [Candidatus Poribacteria bacterium]HIN31792.1 SDR family oxidoreductase [Candidatus Poribacteria bacterium]HIO09613.1 SDR family oxidoreductase [Candidatus Poribacteria bacterium]
MQLKDKVIIVTGGGRGIGEAIAVGYAQEGAKVVVAARSIGQLDQVVEKIQSQGGQAISVPTDARFLPQVENLVQQTVDQFGKIDVLVNNAGINPRGLFLDSTEEEWEQSWQINVVGVVHCCRTVLPVMKAQGRGNIINIGSGMGQVGRGNLSVYCASKFALHGLSQAIAEEVWEDGIIVNVLIPGPVKTELSRPMWEGAGEVQASSDPWKDPEQVVPSAVFLAAQPPSSGMTGQILSIMRRNSP